MADVTTRLILNVQGQDQLKQLSKEHEVLRDKVVALIQSHKEFDTALKDPAIIDAATNLRKIEEQIEKVNGSLGKTTRNWGNAAVQWSRAAQDFQAAGFAGIANNMELMVSSLGGPAILAGVATIAGTFGPLIVRKLASMFEEGVKQGASHLDELEKKLKDLEGKKTKLWIDYVEIDNARGAIEKLKKAHEEVQKIFGQQTKPEAESGKAVVEALSATPEARAAIQKVIEIERARWVEGSGRVMGAREDVERARAAAAAAREHELEPNLEMELLPGAQAASARAQKELEARENALRMAERDARQIADAQIAERIRQAKEGFGPEQARAQQWLASQLGAVNMPGGAATAQAIEAYSPAEMERQDREKEEKKQLAEKKRERAEEQRAEEEMYRETEQWFREQDRALRDEEQKAKQGQREQQHVEREQQRAADERTRDRDRMAREALHDPRIKAAIEMGFMQGGTSEQIAPNLGKFLSQQGLAPESEAPFVGAAAAGQVKEDLNRRLSGYVALGMNQTQAFAAIQEEVLGEMQKLDQKLMLMEQSLLRQQGMMQGFKQTRLNRGDMP